MTADEIIKSVARSNGIALSDLRNPCRARRYSWPRQEAMWRLRRERALSWQQIANLVGVSDHTTVIHGYRAYEQRIKDGVQ